MDDGESTLLAELPNGVRFASALTTGEYPPRHVYRILSPKGAILREYATLLELAEDVNDSDMPTGTAVAPEGHEPGVHDRTHMRTPSTPEVGPARPWASWDQTNIASAHHSLGGALDD